MRFTLTLLCLLAAVSTFAQRGTVRGKVLSSQGMATIPEATIEIPRLKLLTTTNASGEFVIPNAPVGSYEAEVSADGHESQTVSISVGDGSNNMEPIVLQYSTTSQNEATNDIVQSNQNDNTQTDDESGISSGQSVGSALNASRDAFNSASAFAWSTYFYRLRGYEQDQSVTFINGVPMNDLEEGGQLFNNWGGLNDVFRSRNTTLGAQAFENGFGGLGFNTNIDATASNHRKQTRVTASVANRSYRNRLMVTHSTGLMKNGWAFSVSAGRRWAVNGVMPGTFYDSYSYFAGAEKRWGNHSTNLMVVNSTINRGRTSPVMQELFDLAGDNLYNRNWGYQNGQVRNSRVTKQSLPFVVLSDEWRLNKKTLQNFGVSFQTGEVATTGFDWFNTQNPLADYYRNLPSYSNLNGDTAIGAAVKESYMQDPTLLQVQWDDIYQGNDLRSPETINGVTGKRSVVVLGEDVEKQTRINASYSISHLLKDNIMITGGLYAQSQRVHAFRRINDLLGGDYYVNVNGFNTINFGNDGIQIQNDIRNPDRIVRVGDHYNYNYNMTINRYNAWSQLTYTGAKIDAFAALNADMTNFYRTGNYQSGVYQSNSYGKSAVQNFLTGGAKGGATYKLNGRNYVYANGMFGSRAPYYDNVFISARTRNEVAQNVTKENINSLELGYLVRSPKVRGRISVFNTNITNAMDIKRFFDDAQLSNINVVMTGIHKRYQGVEVGMDYKVSPSLSVNLAAALTQATYANRPYLYEYTDNDTTTSNGSATGFVDTAFIKNFNLASGPQSAASLGLNYRSPKFWFATVTVNAFGRNYIDIAPNIRTRRVIDVLDETTASAMHTQRQINSFATLDIFFGKSWRVNKFIKAAPLKSTLFLNIGINNALNNQNIKMMGFEQLRYRSEIPTMFQPKYMYNQGIQYFINAAYSF
ncbi:MAG: hypothetical protein RL660_2088 [Bacteroidota bacterium]|jgi:hypothetical protein